MGKDFFDINIETKKHDEYTNKTFDAIHTISGEVKNAEAEINKLNHMQKHHDDKNKFDINLTSNYDLSKVSIPLNNIYTTSKNVLNRNANTIITMDDDILPDTSGFENTIRKQRKTIDELLENNETLKKNLQASKERIIQLEGENKKLTGEKQELENQLARNQDLLRENEAELFRKLRNFLTQIGQRTKGYTAREQAINLRRNGNEYLSNMRNYLDVCSNILARQIERNNQESEDDKKEIEELKQQKVVLERNIAGHRALILNLLTELNTTKEALKMNREMDGALIGNLAAAIRQKEVDYNILDAQLVAQQALVAQVQAQLGAAGIQNAALQADNAAIVAQRDALQAQLNLSLLVVMGLQGQIGNFQVQVAGLNAGNIALQGQILGLQAQINQLNLDHVNDLNALQQLIDQRDAEIAQLNIDLQGLQDQNALQDIAIDALNVDNDAKDADILALQGQNALLQGANDAKDVQIGLLQANNNAKDAQLLVLQNQNEQKDMRIAVLRAQIALLRQRNNVKDATIAGLQMHNAALQAQIAAKDATIAGLQVQNAQKDADILVLNGQIADLTASVATKNANIGVLEDYVTLLDQIIQEKDLVITVRNVLINTHGLLTATQNANFLLAQNTIVQLEANILELERQNAELGRRNAELVGSNDRLLDWVAARDVTIRAKDALIAIQNANNIEKDNRIGQLEAQLDLAIESRDKNITRRKALGIQIQILQNILTDRKETIRNNNEEIGTLIRERDEALARCTDLNAELDTKNNIISRLNIDNKRLKRRLKESNLLQKRFLKMTNVLKREKRELISESEKKDIQIARLQRRLNKSGESNAQLARQLEAFEEDKRRLTEQLAERDRVLLANNTQLLNRDQQIDQLEAQLLAKDQSITQLEMKSNESKVQLTELLVANDNLQQQINTINQQLTNEQGEKAELEAENEELKRELEAKQEENEDLTAQLGQSNTERTTALQRIEQLNGALLTMNQSLNVKNNRIDALNRNSSDLQNRIGDLQRQLDEKNEEIRKIRIANRILSMYRRERINILSLELKQKTETLTGAVTEFHRLFPVGFLERRAIPQNTKFKIQLEPPLTQRFIGLAQATSDIKQENDELQRVNNELKAEIEERNKYLSSIIENIQKIGKSNEDEKSGEEIFMVDDLGEPINYTGTNIPQDLGEIKNQIERLKLRISKMTPKDDFNEFKRTTQLTITQQQQKIQALEATIATQTQSLSTQGIELKSMAIISEKLETQKSLVTQLRQLLDTSNAENGELKEENERLKEENEGLLRRTQTSEEENIRLKRESKEKNRRLKEENKRLTDNEKRLLTAKEESDKKITALLQNVLSLHNSLLYTTMSKKVSEEQMMQRIRELEQKNRELEQNEQAYKIKINHQAGQLQLQGIRIGELESELETANNKLKNIRTGIKKHKYYDVDGKEIMFNDAEDIADVIRYFQDKLNTAMQENKRISKEKEDNNTQFMTKNLELEKEKTELIRKNRDFMNKDKEAEIEIIRLQNAYQELLSENASLIDENKKIKRDITQKKEEIDTIQPKLIKAQHELLENNARYERTLADLKSKNSLLSTELKERNDTDETVEARVIAILKDIKEKKEEEIRKREVQEKFLNNIVNLESKEYIRLIYDNFGSGFEKDSKEFIDTFDNLYKKNKLVNLVKRDIEEIEFSKIKAEVGDFYNMYEIEEDISYPSYIENKILKLNISVENFYKELHDSIISYLYGTISLVILLIEEINPAFGIISESKNYYPKKQIKGFIKEYYIELFKNDLFNRKASIDLDFEVNKESYDEKTSLTEIFNTEHFTRKSFLKLSDINKFIEIIKNSFDNGYHYILEDTYRLSNSIILKKISNEEFLKCIGDTYIDVPEHDINDSLIDIGFLRNLMRHVNPNISNDILAENDGVTGGGIASTLFLMFFNKYVCVLIILLLVLLYFYIKCQRQKTNYRKSHRNYLLTINQNLNMKSYIQ